MFGERIKAARKAAKMTQEELAYCVEVNRATISKYENNEIKPSIEMLGYIAGALDCDIEYLLGYNNEMRISSEALQLLDAVRRGDCEELERLTGLPKGTFGRLPPEEKNRLALDELHTQTDAYVTKIDERVGKVKEYVSNEHTKTDAVVALIQLNVDSQIAEKLVDDFLSLNSLGQQKAAERVEELTEIPKYRRDPSLPEHKPKNHTKDK